MAAESRGGIVLSCLWLASTAMPGGTVSVKGKDLCWKGCRPLPGNVRSRQPSCIAGVVESILLCILSDRREPYRKCHMCVTVACIAVLNLCWGAAKCIALILGLRLVAFAWWFPFFCLFRPFPFSPFSVHLVFSFSTLLSRVSATAKPGVLLTFHVYDSVGLLSHGVGSLWFPLAWPPNVNIVTCKLDLAVG